MNMVHIFRSLTAAMVTIFSVAAAAAAAEAEACVAVTDVLEFHTPTSEYNAPGAGKIMTEWLTTGSRQAFHSCENMQRLTVSADPLGAFVGTHDDASTFKTSDPDVGIQYRYSLPGSGFVVVDSKGSSATGQVIWGTTADMLLHFRLVQLSATLEDSITVDDHVAFDYTGSAGASGSGKVGMISFTMSKRPPPPTPNCYFGSFSRNIELGYVHTSKLGYDGATTTPEKFSWNYSCTAVSDAWVTYSANSILDADKGWITPTGEAEGVIMEVRRNVTASDPGTPVKFGATLRLGTGGATERMSVHYRRTKAPLKAGEANGTLRIKLEFH